MCKFAVSFVYTFALNCKLSFALYADSASGINLRIFIHTKGLRLSCRHRSLTARKLLGFRVADFVSNNCRHLSHSQVFIMSRKLFLCLPALFLTLFVVTSIQAQQIGPGSGIPAAGVDGAGSRLNIDETVFPNLAAGTYDVLDFEYSAAPIAATNIQPFLAELTGANTYSVLWVGPTVPSPPAGGITTIPFVPGLEQFTLPAATDVYAGFNTDGPNVFFGAGLTDHNNPANFGIAPGSIISGFTNPNLGRSYAFEINVAEAVVPEPSSIAIWLLLSVAAVGFIAYRRRWRAT